MELQQAMSFAEDIHCHTTSKDVVNMIPVDCFSSENLMEDLRELTSGREGSILLSTGLGTLQPGPV